MPLTLFLSILQGLSDLEKGIIRTPLPPRSTFDDDPLRIIRCVRFASRYGFELHADIVEALKDEEIKKALRERISRERVGIEVEKMFGGQFTYYVPPLFRQTRTDAVHACSPQARMPSSRSN